MVQHTIDSVTGVCETDDVLKMLSGMPRVWKGLKGLFPRVAVAVAIDVCGVGVFHRLFVAVTVDVCGVEVFNMLWGLPGLSGISERVFHKLFVVGDVQITQIVLLPAHGKF
jgi:hypothetical protein